MAKNYDNWERLVRAVLRREADRELALTHSGDLSSITISSLSSTSESSAVDILMDYSDLTVDHSEWKAILPPDKKMIIWETAFVRFFLDPTTGKKCFMLGLAKPPMLDLSAPDYHPESRFAAVAHSERNKMMIDIRGMILTQIFSPETLYGSYLVFQLRNKDSYLKLDSASPAFSSVRFISDYDYSGRQVLDLQTSASFRQGNDRGDGWMEIQLGDFYVYQGSRGLVEARFLEMNGYGMEDLVVEGIEFRPPGHPITALFMKPADEVWKRKNRKGKGIFSYFRIPST